MLQTQIQLRKLLWALIYLSLRNTNSLIAGHSKETQNRAAALKGVPSMSSNTAELFSLGSCISPIIQMPEPISQELTSIHPLLPHQDNLG